MNRIRIFLTSILLFVSLGLFSQSIYPVQVNAFAIKHNLRYLSDYYSGTEEPLSVTLLNRDTQQPEIQVKLRLTIRTSDGLVMTTKPEAWFPPVILESGIPERLTMQDLAPYFRPDKLNAQGALTNETLPEGRCEFRFEALDYFTGRVLSSISMATIFLQDLQPPVLQQPLDKQNISFSEPINIVFRWSSSQNNFGMVEYEFTLKEIIDKQANVNSAFLYASTIYKTSTYSTSLPYTADFPLLEPSKRYAWQVRASLPNETGNKNRFENNGLSTIFYFDLREDCQAPMGVNATTDRGKILVSWSPVIGATQYAVQYRRKDFDTDRWYEKFTDDTQLYITDITLGNEYAYQVGTVCIDGKSVYGNTAYIKVPLVDSARMAKCGMMPDVNISNTKPKDMLKKGDKIMAGDFPVILTQVSGGNGTFSGEGYSTLPYIGAFRLAVKFENIGVNEENKLISGFIETKYDESAGGIYNADAVTEGGITSLESGIIKPNITVNYIFPPIPTIEYDAAANVMSFEDGAHQPIGNLQVPKNELGEPVFPFTVQDASNTVYQVDEEIDPATGQPNGKFKFTKLGQQQAPIAEGSIDENLLDYNIGLVTFENTENARYTLDGFLPYYDNVSIIRYNSNMNDDRLYPEVAEDYHVQWKFIPEGATDQVIAKLQIGKDNKIDPAKVIFKSKTGTVFEKTYNEKDKTFTVTLSGAQADSRQDVFALHPSEEEGKYWNLGKLYIDTRAKPQAFKVVLVNLGGEYNKEDISSGLNKIYNRVGIAWQVEEYNDFTTTEDLENLYDKSSGLLSAYNDKMKAINTALIEKLGDEYDPGACYVLMMKTGNVDKKDRNVTGFMPRGNQFCYIYTAKMDNLTAGIAHELGHGKFKLKHTFDSEYGNAAEATKGETANLMDYSSGGVLTKWQWDEIYNPAVLNAVFDGDGEGMMSLPCLGIFDDCDDVLKKLEAFKKANQDKKTVTGKVPPRLNEKILVAKSIKLDKTDFTTVNVVLYGESRDYTINPKKYNDFYYTITPYEDNPEKRILARGFEFKDLKANTLVMRIFIEETSDKMIEKYDAFKAYLFDEKKATTEAKTTIEPLIPEDDFISQGSGDCFATCKKIMAKYDKDYIVPSNLWALATTNGTDKTYIHKECYEKAIIALDNLLDGGSPVMVGVDYKSGSSNFDGITDHWVIITGRNNDEQGTYYTYFEVAQNDEKGSSTVENRFYLNENGYLEAIGKTVNKSRSKPIVTVMRVEPNDCACDRNNYENKLPKKECGTEYNNKTSPKGTLIKIRD